MTNSKEATTRQRVVDNGALPEHKNLEKYTEGGFPQSQVWQAGTLMDTLFLSPHKWIQKKRDFDGHGKLWRVRDNLYDLANYVDKHPGGSDWLSITQGTDITELFMSSHIINVNMVESVLKKYYVGPAEGPRKTPYTWKEDDFYMTLKKRLAPILEKTGTSTTLKINLWMDFLGIAFLAGMALGTVYNSYLILIFSGLILNYVCACAHNFIHTRYNWRRYWHDLSPLPSYEFQIFHCISHHVFPNTLLDWEHVSAEPLVSFSHKDHKNWFQRFGPALYVHLPFATGLWYFYIYKMFRIFVLREHKWRHENGIILLELLGLWAISPTFTHAFTCWFITHAAFSYWFIMIGYNATHHNTDCFNDGDHIRHDPDWGLCQMDATRDTRIDWCQNFCVQSTTFTEHPLHHMLPTVCCSRYKPLKPIFMDTMDEFGMKYPRYSRLESLFDSFQNFAKITPNIFGAAAKSVN